MYFTRSAQELRISVKIMNPDERVFQPNFPHGGSTIPRIQSNIVRMSNLKKNHSLGYTTSYDDVCSNKDCGSWSIIISSENANVDTSLGDAGFLGSAKTAVVNDGTNAHSFHIDYQNGHIY